MNFRASARKNLQRQGFEVEQLNACLGHSTAVAIKHYGRTSEDDIKRASQIAVVLTARPSKYHKLPKTKKRPRFLKFRRWSSTSKWIRTINLRFRRTTRNDPADALLQEKQAFSPCFAKHFSIANHCQQLQTFRELSRPNRESSRLVNSSAVRELFCSEQMLKCI